MSTKEKLAQVLHECTFLVNVRWSDDSRDSEVEISCNLDPPPPVALQVATEHMMTACALDSGAGFDQTLLLLLANARNNKVREFRGVKTQ